MTHTHNRERERERVNKQRYPEFVAFNVGAIETHNAGMVAITQHLNLLGHCSERVVIGALILRPKDNIYQTSASPNAIGK